MKDRIKYIREYLSSKNGKKVSQAEFANDLGVSLSNIKSYELGRRAPSDAFIQLICNKYSINEEWLRSGTGEMKAPLTREEEIGKITAQMFKDTDSSMRYQLQLLLSQMSEDDIRKFVCAAKKIVDVADSINYFD